MEEKIREDLVEVHVIKKNENFKVLSKDELKDLMRNLKELN